MRRNSLSGQPRNAETFRTKFAKRDIYESIGTEPFGARPSARGWRYRELFGRAGAQSKARIHPGLRLTGRQRGGCRASV